MVRVTGIVRGINLGRDGKIRRDGGGKVVVLLGFVNRVFFFFSLRVLGGK